MKIGWNLSNSLLRCEIFNRANKTLGTSIGPVIGGRSRPLIGIALSSVGLLVTLAGFSRFVTGTPAARVPAQTPGTWTATGSMSVARSTLTATLLTNGKVLAAGGRDSFDNALSSAELYDPSTRTWTATGSMNSAHSVHTATLLPDGKVLVAGGQNASGAISSAELYDPATGLWTATGSMSTARVSHMATLITQGALAGKVLVAGGSSMCSGCTPILDSAELYDPSTGLWAGTGSMTIARYWYDPSPSTLPDGSVLVVGGTTCCPSHWFNNAEVYNPASQTWTLLSPKMTSANEETALLPNGTILVAGGVKGTQPNFVYVASAELFDSLTGTWAATGSMSTDRTLHRLIALTSGQVLAVGGASGGADVCNSLKSAELYDSNVGSWFPTGNMRAARFFFSATLLPNGQVLAAGGQDCEDNFLSSAELYTPSGETSTCLAPPSGLVSWWSGDKTAADVQGINPGVLKNGVSFRPGKVGPGFLFDGIDDIVTIPNSTSLSQTRLTVDAWVFPTGNVGLNRHILSKDHQFVAREYILGIQDIDRYNAFVGTNNGDFDLFSSTAPTLNAWTHLAMTHDGQTLRLYVNGVLDASMSAPGDIVPTSNPVGIGANITGAFFKGIIDEPQIFNRALTDAEILAIYQAGADGQCKPNIFVASIDPSFQTRGHEYSISTSVTIQDINGVGTEDARAQIATTFPDGQIVTSAVTTDQTGQATLTFSTTSTGLYQFKVRKVTHPTREYDSSLNIETSDTLLIP